MNQAIDPSGPASAVALIIDPDDPVAAAVPVAWAIDQLAAALAVHGIGLRRIPHLDAALPGEICVAAAGPQADIAGQPAVPAAPESLVLGTRIQDGRPVVDARGRDARGLVYALTELADRVRHASDWQDALQIAAPLAESPAAPLRSIARAFCSRTEDLAWFHDREMWCAYLDMLVTNRFNRFALTLGMQYNYPYHNQWISDTFLYFPYPFLVGVPGYDVHVPELPEAERAQNLASLCFIGAEAARRGLDFQLALWTHGYDFDAVPQATYNVRGITRDNHAPYCRDALALILKACPEITGITLRVHVEGGIAEGDYGFWGTLFEALPSAGRQIGIDLHAKGIDRVMIDTALATGMPVTISAKYTGEHMGLPYHQASIRAIEQTPRETVGTRMAFSEGARRFMRYSYGDLLREDRRYGVLFRIWPGTQRILLWGDPALAAGYGHSAGLCGCLGVELCEPLFFAGRMGSAPPGLRFNYVDSSLRTSYDWEKYLYQVPPLGPAHLQSVPPRRRLAATSEAPLRRRRRGVGDRPRTCQPGAAPGDAQLRPLGVEQQLLARAAPEHVAGGGARGTSARHGHAEARPLRYRRPARSAAVPEPTRLCRRPARGRAAGEIHAVRRRHLARRLRRAGGGGAGAGPRVGRRRRTGGAPDRDRYRDPGGARSRLRRQVPRRVLVGVVLGLR